MANAANSKVTLIVSSGKLLYAVQAYVINYRKSFPAASSLWKAVKAQFPRFADYKLMLMIEGDLSMARFSGPEWGISFRLSHPVVLYPINEPQQAAA